MTMKRALVAMLASASLIVAGDLALARNNDNGKGPPGKEGQEHGNAHKHMHMHKNAHNLLGEKLKHNGKHEVDKFANRTVTADVKDGKVTNMAAGDLPVKRVKTKMKMASNENGIIPAAWGGSLQLVQYSDYYYAYCFDDGIDLDCYWYPASDIDYLNATWDDYDPYY
jgi:hypothetical protein